MLLSDAIKKRLSYYFAQKDMITWDLFKSTGINKSTLYAIVNGETELPQIDTILHICEGFGITLREFFDDEIFEDVVQEKKEE